MEVQCLTNRNSKKQELEKKKGQEFIKEYKTSDIGSIWWLTQRMKFHNTECRNKVLKAS